MSMPTTYQTVKVADRRTGSALNVFYREAGLKDASVVLLDASAPAQTDSADYRTNCKPCHMPARATGYIYMQG